MTNYEQAKEEFLMFQNALDNAKKTEMEVEWFIHFIDSINNELNVNKSIQTANKKLGM